MSRCAGAEVGIIEARAAYDRAQELETKHFSSCLECDLDRRRFCGLGLDLMRAAAAAFEIERVARLAGVLQ